MSDHTTLETRQGIAPSILFAYPDTDICPRSSILDMSIRIMPAPPPVSVVEMTFLGNRQAARSYASLQENILSHRFLRMATSQDFAEKQIDRSAERKALLQTPASVNRLTTTQAGPRAKSVVRPATSSLAVQNVRNPRRDIINLAQSRNPDQLALCVIVANQR